MPTIYISDSGDDKNDGLSLQTAISVITIDNRLRALDELCIEIFPALSLTDDEA
jgi:hypothetical protein